jgi:hypothetical protein
MFLVCLRAQAIDHTILYKCNDHPLKDCSVNRVDINFRELKGRPLTLEYHDRIEIQTQ